MTESEKILKYLKSRPSISIQILEKECKIPLQSIAKAMVGVRVIPSEHCEKIIAVLRKYGYKNKSELIA